MSIPARSFAVLLAAPIFLLAAACGAKNEDAAPAATPPPANPGAGLKLNEEMLKNVSIEEVRSTALPVTLKTSGKVQFNEDRVAAILAPLSGHVVGLSVKVGNAVRKGDVLFSINSRDVAAAIAEHIDSHTDLALSEKTYAMTRDLFANQAVSNIALQQAENDLTKARGRVARNEAALRALGVADPKKSDELTSLIPVRSPLDGKVIERRIAEGQFQTGDNTSLLTIADLSSVWIVADIFEKDLGAAAPGLRAEAQTLAYPGSKFTGTVTRVSDVLDPATRTVKVHLEVPNPDGRLKPEMFAGVTLHLREDEPGLTVPVRAVFTEEGKHYVFAEKEPGTFERRCLEVLPATPDRWRVAKGLKPGDRVVTENVMLLLGQEVSGN